MVPTRARRGAHLYLESHPSRQVYFVRQGSVSLASTAYGGGGAGPPKAQAPDRAPDPDQHDAQADPAADTGADNVVVRSLKGPGSVLGLEALLGSDYRSTARAETDAKVCVMQAERFRDWVATTPALALALLRRCVDESTSPASRNVRGSSLARVAAYVLKAAPSETGPALRAMPTTPRWRVVADLLDMRPETLSRCLERLETMGALRRANGKVTVVRKDLLADVAGETQNREISAAEPAQSARCSSTA
jgi:CRP-like cAMP-binding protein